MIGTYIVSHYRGRARAIAAGNGAQQGRVGLQRFVPFPGDKVAVTLLAAASTLTYVPGLLPLGSRAFEGK